MWRWRGYSIERGCRETAEGLISDWEGRHFHLCPFAFLLWDPDPRSLAPVLSGFFDFSSTNAAGADVLPADTAALHDAYLLDIRPPDSLRFPVGMAHMIPEDGSLAAYGTDP